MISRKSIYLRQSENIIKLLVILVLITSCTGQQNSEHLASISFEDLPKIIPNHIRTVGSTSNFFFGDIIDVKVLQNGKIIVLDDQTMSVHLLSKDGEYENYLEFQGRGPGEIQNLSKRLRVTSENIMAIDDYMMYKISLYQINDDKFDHLTDVALETSTEDYFLKNDYELILRKSGQKNDDIIQIIDINDDLYKGMILNFPAHEEIFLTANMGGLSFNLETSTVFHTRNNFCAENDLLYHVRTDTIGLSAYDLIDGKELYKSYHKQERERISYEEKEAAIDSLLDSGSELWGESVREKLITEMPDFKPLVSNVKCDLPNGIWMKLMDDGAEEDEKEERWILFSEDGEIKGLFTNNLDGKIISFHKGNIFTSNISDDGEIVLDTYEYKITQ